MIMDKDSRYSMLLDKQIREFQKENRSLEFKSNYQDAEKLGEYISALSNGACLDHQEFAYLYFGVEDATLRVKGTTFDASVVKAKGNQALEMYLRPLVFPRIAFVFEEFKYHDNSRVVRLKIPAAIGEPTTFHNRSYIRVDSHVTELTRYVEWMREIYSSRLDWTAQIVDDATIRDLDAEAVKIAREGYKERHPQYADQLLQWSDEVFLDKACLTLDGQITRAAMLLVGKREKAHKIPHIAEITWKCFQDGETFGDTFTIPFIKSTSEVLKRIRNYRFKIYPINSLIPAEVWKYDARSVLEALHNCVAHQDYSLDERIRVTEEKEKLTFENAGCFFDGDYSQYILGEKTPKRYRNPALMKAMVNVKMIDSQGYGIHNLFLRQKERFLPMPDYEGSSESQVVLHLPGMVIDADYSQLLMSNNEVNLTEAILLDNLQKGKRIGDDAIALLRKKHLVEGRKPHVYIAKSVAQKTNTKVEYSKHKGLKNKLCESLLLDALADHKVLTRKDIDVLLWDALSDQYSENQKKNKIGNLLTRLRKMGIITNNTAGRKSEWKLVKK